MPLDLLIVNPGGRKQVYQDLAHDLAAIEPPLWCRLIAGYARDRGWQVAILDSEAENLGPQRVAEKVRALAPRLVAMVVYGHQPSASTQSMVGAGEICRAIKAREPERRIVMVGGHVAALPERTLNEEAIDYACNGEGPVTIDGLLAGDGLITVPGLVWRDGETIRNNLAAPLVPMESLHGDAWDLLPMPRYRAHNWQCLDGSPRQPYASIMTSLGCPYSCSFCLPAGTLIVTARGLNKPIEKLSVGDRLLAWDESTRQIVETTISRTASRVAERLIRITVSSGEAVEATEEHPIFTERGWVAAGEIRATDRILVMDRADKVKYLRRTHPMPNEVRAKISTTLKAQKKRLSETMTRRWAEGKIKGRAMSPAAKQAAAERMRAKNPMHRADVRAKVSDALKARYASGDVVPFLATPEGRRVIADIARRRALADNPMKDPAIVNHPEFKALRSANMRARWADPEQAAHLIAVKKRGPEHLNWKGGLSSQPYPLAFSPRLKRKIRQRDKDACRNCGATERLSVHHIDYVKDNLDECNLITLCVSCNSKANYDRPTWQAFYSEKMMALGQCPHFERITTIEERRGQFRVYNFECSPHDNYWAGFVLVHNCMINAPFDAATGGKHRYRKRSPLDVVAEIGKLVALYDVKTFKISDEMFVLHPKHYLAICEMLALQPYAGELNIWAYARVDTVKAENLAVMRKAGIRWLALGIESGSAHVRDGADKAFDQDDIYAIVRQIQAAGINVLGNFIFGLPDDTKLSMLATLDMARQLNLEFANFYCAMPYPGSRLYNETPAEHLPPSWSAYSQHSFETTPLPTDTLSAAEVLAFRDAAFASYFTDPAYLDRVKWKFGIAARDQVVAMAAQPLRRKLLAA